MEFYGQATNAKDETIIGQEKEQVEIAYVSAAINKLGKNVTAADLQDELDKVAITEVTDNGDGTLNVLFNDTQHNYNVDKGDVKFFIPISTQTVAELYDGINDPNDEEYNESAMHIGDYVRYDAGVWTEDTIPSTNFKNIEVGQSRNSLGENTSWRIWDISDNKKTITLISTGCPEAFYYVGSEFTEYKYNVEKILTGSTLGAAFVSEVRDWSMYVNKSMHATNAGTINKDDFEDWYKKYIDSSVITVEEVALPENNENKLISVLANNEEYWLATPGENWNSLYSYSEWSDSINSLCLCECWVDMDYETLGIRVKIDFDDTIEFYKDYNTIEENGFSYNIWNIR